MVALGLGVFAGAENQRADRAEQLADAASPRSSPTPTGRRRRADITSGGTGTIVVAGDQAIFRATDVTTLPGDRTYQLWIIDAKGARSAGVLGRGRHGDIPQFVEGVKDTDQIGLTVEPKGGSEAADHQARRGAARARLTARCATGGYPRALTSRENTHGSRAAAGHDGPAHGRPVGRGQQRQRDPAIAARGGPPRGVVRLGSSCQHRAARPPTPWRARWPAPRR